MPPKPRIAAAGLALILGACGMFAGDPEPPCPRAYILDDTSQVIQFREGGGSDLVDVRFEGRIVDVASECTHGDNGYVDVALAFLWIASRGPAAEGNVGHYAYFVAVTDPDRNIVAKEIFEVAVDFAGNRLNATRREDVTQRIVVPSGGDARGYQVFIGFQLTRDQLEYIRSRRRL